MGRWRWSGLLGLCLVAGSDLARAEAPSPNDWLAEAQKARGAVEEASRERPLPPVLDAQASSRADEPAPLSPLRLQWTSGCRGRRALVEGAAQARGGAVADAVEDESEER